MKEMCVWDAVVTESFKSSLKEKGIDFNKDFNNSQKHQIALGFLDRLFESQILTFACPVLTSREMEEKRFNLKR